MISANSSDGMVGLNFHVGFLRIPDPGGPIIGTGDDHGMVTTGPGKRGHAPHISVSAVAVHVTVETGEFDVGFSGVRLPGRDLVHRPIATDEIVLAVPPLHPFASRDSVELSELAGQPFLTRESGSGTHLSFLALLAEQGLELPPYRSVMVLSNTAAIVSAVGRGYGIGLVSCLALKGRGPGGPVAVRIAGLAMTRWLYLVVEKDRPLPPPAASFAEWVPSQDAPACA